MTRIEREAGRRAAGGDAPEQAAASRGRDRVPPGRRGVDDRPTPAGRSGCGTARACVTCTPCSPGPGTAVAALDLAAGRRARLAAAPDTGEVIDAQARSAYRQRLRELEEAAAEADAAADIERSARVAAERDALVEALTQAYGLGGRVRRPGSAAERARTAVTARIKDAIRRIGEAHPDLGRHLARSVRTGTFCSYEPDQPARWSG